MEADRERSSAVQIDNSPARSPNVARMLPGFLVLYGALYLAYGTESAYLPAFLLSHGLALEQIGLMLAIGTIVRIGAGPLIGRFADSIGAPKQALSVAACLSGLIGSVYNFAFGFAPLLAVGIFHAAATASLAPLSDALSVTASARGRAFQYGWVRGAGSVAFICGTLLSGQLIDRFGLSSIIMTSSAFFLIMAVSAVCIRSPLEVTEVVEKREAGAFGLLWRIGPYRRLVVVAFLVIGSHALNDTFAVIQWREAGFSNLSVSLMWSEAVMAEVIVFLLLGPWLIVRLGLAGAAALSAGAGVLRWSVMASTTVMPALIGVQALHGLTFALMHLAAMGIIAQSVPARMAATAQTIYGTGALGIASAIMTTASGYLYGIFNAQAFWAMAASCAIALPLTRRLPGTP
jgi:MFS transporter, PPP family, 3-phenylpropionic acid transporter